MRDQIIGLWSQGKPEIITVAVVFVLGMTWGAVGMYLFGDPRGSWK